MDSHTEIFKNELKTDTFTYSCIFRGEVDTKLENLWKQKSNSTELPPPLLVFIDVVPTD